MNDHPFKKDTAERVGAIVYDIDDKLLVVEGGGKKISLPKGCRQLGETEWEGSVRELYEETGLDIEVMLSEKSAKFIENRKLRWGSYMVFRLPFCGTDLKLRPQLGETVKVMWKSPQSEWMQKTADLNTDLRSLVSQQRWGFKNRLHTSAMQWR